MSAEAVLRELGLFELSCRDEDVPAKREDTGEGGIGGAGGVGEGVFEGVLGVWGCKGVV